MTTVLARSRRTPIAVGVVCLLLAGALLVRCGGTGGADDGNGYVSADGSVRTIDPADRSDPIVLTGTGLDDQPIDVSDYRGKPVVIVVWGAWCGPCRAEAPELVQAADELADQVQFVGIDVRDNPAQALAHVREFGVPYPSIDSPDAAALLSFSGVISANSVPSTIVLDAEGRVAASIIGPLPSEQTLVDLVKDTTGAGHG